MTVSAANKLFAPYRGRRPDLVPVQVPRVCPPTAPLSRPCCYPYNYKCWRFWDLVARKMLISDSATLSSLSISLGMAGIGTPADSFRRVLSGYEPALRAFRPLIPAELPLPALPDPEPVLVDVVPAPPCRSLDEDRQGPRVPLNQLVAIWLYPINY